MKDALKGFTENELYYESIENMSRNELDALAQKLSLNMKVCNDMDDDDLRELLIEKTQDIVVTIRVESEINNYIYNKHELLTAIKAFSSKPTNKAFSSYLKRFAEEVAISHLPSNPPLWSYFVELNTDAFELHWAKHWVAGYDRDYVSIYELFDDFMFDCYAADYVLISMPIEKMPLSEYAAENGVEPITVRQWIRRGQLRDVYMIGNDWFISKLAVHTDGYKRYIPVKYYWNEKLKGVPDEWWFLSKIDNIMISQNGISQKYEISYQEITSLGPNKVIINPDMDKVEKEKLELFLLKHPRIKNNQAFIARFDGKYVH